MNFLRELNKQQINESGEAGLSSIPHDVYNDLENHIRNGAKDMDKEVENALELVKEAYKVENVELPSPSMKEAWKQFSTLIEYATSKLHKYRGIDGDWRLSAYMFREHVETRSTFAATIKNGNSISQSTLYADDKESLIKYLTNELTDGETAPKITEEGNQIRIELSIMNVKQQGLLITLTEI